MLADWIEIADSVLRPSRPYGERCVQERAAHLASRRLVAEERARAIAGCERRIETARAAVFAANDGVVTSHMTELEREWRALSRRDRDDGLMDLWARISPPSWIDEKRWRGNDEPDRLGMAVVLAADPGGVERAEAAVASLRDALAPWGTPVGAKIRWRALGEQSMAASGALVEELMEAPLRAACDRLEASDAKDVVLDRARRLARDVHEALHARLPDSAVTANLARGLSHAAFVDYVWHAAVGLFVSLLDAAPNQRFADLVNPVAPLCALWRTGYALASVDSSTVTLAADLTWIGSLDDTATDRLDSAASAGAAPAYAARLRT